MLSRALLSTRCLSKKPSSSIFFQSLSIHTGISKGKHENSKSTGVIAAASVALAAVTFCSAAESTKTANASTPKYYSSAEEFLYPPIEPYRTGMLKVSNLHTLYYEECGNPNGKVECHTQFIY
jgi:hypothetical protein